MTTPWPVWWQWELELTPHAYKRMTDRDFDELDPRRMLEGATGFRDDIIEGRFVIETTHRGRPSEVIVEPWKIPASATLTSASRLQLYIRDCTIVG